MTRQSALRKIAEGLFEYADAMYEEEQAAAPVLRAPTPAYVQASASGVTEPDELFPPFEPEVPAPQGALANCPKHHVPYSSGTYGPFCKSTTDDPAWGKAKGDKLWCRITPRNAAEWLRITAA
jgi:hypothetical protein